MIKYFKMAILVVALAAHAAPLALADTATSTVPATRDDLQAQIDAKTQALNQVNAQLQETQKSLDTVQTQRRSLQTELSTLNSNIKTLNLGIQSDQLNVQRLSLQTDQLNYDLTDIQSEIQAKRDAVGALFRELAKKENENANLLLVFLKENSLADGVLETQSLNDLQAQLVVDIGNLRDLNDAYNNKIKEISDNQAQINQHQENLKNRESIVSDQKSERQALLVDTKQKESVYQQKLDDLKQQQNQLSDEIGQIEDQLRASFNSNLLPLPRAGVLAWPVGMRAEGGIGVITQHYGERSALYRGKPHNGLDIGVPIGTPVYAAADGTVLAVDNNDKSSWAKYQYGKYVLIQHNDNLATLYGHLSKQVVMKGEAVKRGDLIGYSGSTGYATGPHVHLGLYWAPSILMKALPPAAGLVPVGVTVNPEDYLCGQSCPIDGT